MCLLEGDMPPGPNDLELGRLGGSPFYIGAEQYERWGRPEFVLDVSAGAADSFSLEFELDVHFVSKTEGGSPSCPAA